MSDVGITAGMIPQGAAFGYATPTQDPLYNQSTHVLLNTTGLPPGGSVGQGVVNVSPGVGSWQNILLPGNTPLTKTVSYQLLTNDTYVNYDTTSGNLVATLPATPVSGQLYAIAKVDSTTHIVTITPPSGSINGQSNYTIGAQYNTVLLGYDGANWTILGVNIPPRVFDITQYPYSCIADSNGTTGNGTDNTAGFNAAITAASVNGGTIYVPSSAGKWFRLATSGVTISGSNVHVVGQGIGVSQIFFDSTDIVHKRLLFNGGTNVSLREITIGGIRSAGVGGGGHNVDFYDCIGVVCSHVESVNSSQMGIVSEGCDDIEISGCISHHCGNDGIHCSASTVRPSTGLRIIGNVINDTNDDGLAINYLAANSVNDAVICGNSVRNSGSRGIAIMGVFNGVSVTGNTVDSTWLSGIWADSSQGASQGLVITGNTILSAGTYTGAPNARGVGIGAGIILDGFGNALAYCIVNDNIIINPRNGYIWLGGLTSGSTTVDIYQSSIGSNVCQVLNGVGGLGAAAGAGGGVSQSPSTAHYPGIYVRNCQSLRVHDINMYNAYQEGLLADSHNSNITIVQDCQFYLCNSSATAALNGVTISSGEGAATGVIVDGGTFSNAVSLTTSVLNANNVLSA